MRGVDSAPGSGQSATLPGSNTVQALRACGSLAALAPRRLAEASRAATSAGVSGAAQCAQACTSCEQWRKSAVQTINPIRVVAVSAHSPQQWFALELVYISRRQADPAGQSVRGQQASRSADAELHTTLPLPSCEGHKRYVHASEVMCRSGVSRHRNTPVHTFDPKTDAMQPACRAHAAS